METVLMIKWVEFPGKKHFLSSRFSLHMYLAILFAPFSGIMAIVLSS